MLHLRVRIVSFILALLFVMHIVLMGSSAYAYQDKGAAGIASLTGGRKMMKFKVPMRKERVKEGANIGGIPKISGKDMKASNDPLGSSQETLNSQGPVLMIDQETDHHDDQQNIDETRRLLEAAKEIVSLMHKDYKGMGRRKPPINNHEPSH